MNSVRSNNISLKYQRFTTLGSKDIEIINSEFVIKTQFLWSVLNMYSYTISDCKTTGGQHWLIDCKSVDK